jgi:hypothetical protein
MEQAYAELYHAEADLYVCFYQQQLCVLRGRQHVVDRDQQMAARFIRSPRHSNSGVIRPSPYLE